MFRGQPRKISRSAAEVASRQSRNAAPQIIPVTDRVYSAVGYARANVPYVVTDQSVVVIDTTESPAGARASLDAFRKICPLPVSYIIYTHFHGDHIRGAKAFHTPKTKIVAQKRLPEEVAKVNLLLPYYARVTALQFGLNLKAKPGRISPRNPPPSRRRRMFILPLDENGYVAPDITFDEEYCFEEGGVRFELYHMPGETFDQLIVWLPHEKVLFPADLFYQSFPMLSSPMKPDRPVLDWAKSLDRMRAFHPNYLVPSHGRPLVGSDRIDSALANYAKAIRHVHDQTVKHINQGLTLEQIRRQVRLPQELARLPYLQQHFGTVRWAINGIFRQYTGWYTLNPEDLNPSPRAVLDQALLEACGGPEPLLDRAHRALSEGQAQLALELVAPVLAVKPRHVAAQNLRARALQRLGAVAKNGVERNIYLTAAQEASRMAG
jgi:alkyl sulfatase BDS1-like metallo-beta-lactamase superfamily hydrolase